MVVGLSTSYCEVNEVAAWIAGKLLGAVVLVWLGALYGLGKFRPWGRTAAIGLNILFVLHWIAQMFVCPRPQKFRMSEFLIGIAVSVIPAACVIGYFTRPSVKALFESRTWL